MPVQRQVFRIEEGLRRRATDGAAAPHAAVDRDAFERARAQIAEAEAYQHELGLIYAAVEEMSAPGADAPGSGRTARACRELAAIVGGTERAAQSILQAAEDIDEAANTLSASARHGHDQALAHDIRDRVVQIFEACNFQDLTGQRVAHVLATLKHVEEHIARLMTIWHRVERFTPVVFDDDARGDQRLLNGPKLPEDRGHSTQHDIDVMFRCA